MVVGPSRPAPSVLARLAEPAPPLTDRDFLAEFAECMDLLRHISSGGPSLPIVVPGTGTTGMESLVTSLLEPGRPVVVLSTGMWGDRWRDICQRNGIPTRSLTSGFGAPPNVGALQLVLEQRDYQAVLVTHVDSSSGVRASVDVVAALAARHGALTLVDGVAALGAEHVAQYDWGIDAYLAGPAKALAAPPGLAIVLLGHRALDLLERRTWTPPSYSLDLLPWVPVMRAAGRCQPGYFQTPAGNLVAALTQALRLVTHEGLAERIVRHYHLRDRLHSGLIDLGVRPAVDNEEARSNVATVCWVPDGWDRDEFVSAVAAAGVLTQTGTHPAAAHRTFRIGHLGNVTEEDIDRTLAAIGMVLGHGTGEVRHG
jgi:alanine-glyoxylate transaminase/serine-glyoxylate transaminase/serine-pyruvate transaminase